MYISGMAEVTAFKFVMMIDYQENYPKMQKIDETRDR